MSLAPGQSVGPYAVVCSLGAGGMGEVYRARDTQLDRDVALKILPELFAGDPERVLRFTREAKTLAALNHPNIAAIYGIEGNALVMELVEGEDLSAHIARGPIALPEALAIARQIVEALEAAHDAGIIHRDLKPANIKVREDGTVKVLDFGLARTLEDVSGIQDVSHSPTLTARATALGMIIGTAAYMSPEQARDRAVDKRSDVWAFGCVLYEMLSGTKTFDGEDATEIISAVVKSEPDWTALPASVPAHIRALVMRCLVKDRKARIPDLSVVRYMLDGTIPVAGAQEAAPSRTAARVWQAATAVFVLTTLAGGAAWYRARAVTPPVARFVITAPDNQTFTAGSRAGATAPIISPDGRTIAFTAQDANGRRLLWVRAIDALEARLLPGTEGAAYPFWSPDSRAIGYAVVGKLMRVDATGGAPTTLCVLNPGIVGRGGAWNRDGVIIFNNGPAPLYRVSSAGGEATVMGELAAGETGRQFPAFLPDGRHFFYHASGSGERGGVYVGSLDSSETTRVLSASSGAIHDRTSGRVLFAREGTLLAQAFDQNRFAVTGDPFPIAEHVESTAVPGVVAFSLSETSVLAYGVGEAAGVGLRLTWLDRQGKVAGMIGPPATYRGFNLAPDQSQVAAHRHDGEGGDIWITDVSRSTTSRFTFDPAQDNSSPVWSPDGNRIAFSSIRNGKPGIYVKPSNGAGNEERLFETSEARGLTVLSWTPDHRILFGVSGVKTTRDLWMVPVDGERKAVPLLQSPFGEWVGQISPDGRWVAYASNETGTAEIYVQSIPTGSGKWTISNGGGSSPRWRGDSRELFYVGGGKLWAVEVAKKGAAFAAGQPSALFDLAGMSPNDFSFAVTRDGQRFLAALRPSGEDERSQSPIVVVLNWLEGAAR
ncbi:MAG: protein kinase [Vicinamibacterales bacterium]